jgi:WD40 repeat protein
VPGKVDMKIRRFIAVLWTGSFLTLAGCMDMLDFPGSNQHDRGLVLSSDGSLLAPQAGPNPKVWDTRTKRALWEVGRDMYSRIDSVAFSPDATTVASGDLDGNVKLRGARTGALFWAGKHDGRVNALAFSPDGRILATGVGRCGAGDALIQFWDAETGKVLRQSISAHGDQVYGVAFSPDGETLASRGHDDESIKLWDMRNGGHLQTLSGHNDVVPTVAFSPEGRVLASGSFDNDVKLWDVKRGALIHTLSGHGDKVWQVVFSQDGKTLVSSSEDATINVWDAETGRLIRTLKGHTGPVLSVAFSPNGKVLASGSQDATVKLWYAGTGDIIRTVREPDLTDIVREHGTSAFFRWFVWPYGHRFKVEALTFLPDGKTLASASLGHVMFLDVEGEALKGSDGKR